MSYRPTQELVVERLDVDACTRLLERGGVGRVGFVSGDDVIILPVKHAPAATTLWFEDTPQEVGS